uniref:Uncharacterized protein n=1 Tax=Kalanchoe fedtschenkoi TaxID=63787 RepID=A0A7N0TFF5_KALFE
MSSGAYEKVKAGRLTFKDGTLATRSKPIDKKKKRKKKTDKGPQLQSDDVVNIENEAQINEEGPGEGGSGEIVYTIDAAKKMKYEELFPVEAKKFSYDPKAKVKSVEQALDDRVKKKADRYCK